MHAVAYTRPLPVDDPDALVDIELPDPVPEVRDLLVEVHAVSVNPVDVKQRASADPGGTPRVLGYDASGVVRAVGAEVTGFVPGDEVFYAGALDRQGSDAELQVVDERVVARKPANLSFAEAAALPLTALTAAEALKDKLRIGPETSGTLLVVGATGGVGSVLLQLARAWAPDLRLVATASGDEDEEWVTDHGASLTVDHHGDLGAQVRRAVPGGLTHVFSAHTSQDSLATYADLLVPFGQVVAIDDPQTLDVTGLKAKALSMHWEFMFARSMHHAPDLARQHDLLDEVRALVEAGRVRSTMTTLLTGIDAHQLRTAHRLVESGHVTGKVVLER